MKNEDEKTLLINKITNKLQKYTINDLYKISNYLDTRSTNNSSSNSIETSTENGNAENESSDEGLFNDLCDAVFNNDIGKLTTLLETNKNIPLSLGKKTIIEAAIPSPKYSTLEQYTAVFKLIAEKTQEKIDINKHDAAKEALSLLYNEYYHYIDEKYIDNTFSGVCVSGESGASIVDIIMD